MNDYFPKHYNAAVHCSLHKICSLWVRDRYFTYNLDEFFKEFNSYCKAVFSLTSPECCAVPVFRLPTRQRSRRSCRRV